MLLTSYSRLSCNAQLIWLNQRESTVSSKYRGEPLIEIQKVSYSENIAGNWS